MVSLLRKLHRRVRRLERPPQPIDIHKSATFSGRARSLFAHYFPKAPSRFHHWFSNRLDTLHEQRGQKLCIMAPRESAKSTWILSYAIDAACAGLEPYIILTADTSDQAEKYLEAIKHEFEDNEQLAAAYPAACGKGPLWRNDAIETNNGVRIEALSTGKKIRGRKHGPHRPSLIIVDDPQNKDHINSPLKRDRSWQWMMQDVCNAGSPDTNLVVVGTPLHEESIVYKLRTVPGWECKTFQEVESWPERMDLWAEWERLLFSWEDQDRDTKADAFYQTNKVIMGHGARILWPEHHPLDWLMRKRAEIGEGAFGFEYQMEPTDPSLAMWPARYFERDDFWFDKWPEDLQIRLVYLDPAIGKNAKKHDWSAFVLYGDQGPQGRAYCEGVLVHLPPEQLAGIGVGIMERFNPDCFGFEANGFQELLGKFFRDAATAAKLTFNYRLDYNQTNKIARIQRLSVPLSSGRLRFKRTPGTMELVKQLRQFPTGKFDDGPDALEGVIRLADEVYRGRNMKNDTHRHR